jgi:hypothetical protein
MRMGSGRSVRSARKMSKVENLVFSFVHMWGEGGRREGRRGGREEGGREGEGGEGGREGGERRGGEEGGGGRGGEGSGGREGREGVRSQVTSEVVGYLTCAQCTS